MSYVNDMNVVGKLTGGELSLQLKPWAFHSYLRTAWIKAAWCDTFFLWTQTACLCLSRSVGAFR